MRYQGGKPAPREDARGTCADGCTKTIDRPAAATANDQPASGGASPPPEKSAGPPPEKSASAPPAKSTLAPPMKSALAPLTPPTGWSGPDPRGGWAALPQMGPDPRISLERTLLTGKRCKSGARLPRIAYDERTGRVGLAGKRVSWMLPWGWGRPRIERHDMVSLSGASPRGIFSVVELFVAPRCDSYETSAIHERVATRGLIDLLAPERYRRRALRREKLGRSSAAGPRRKRQSSPSAELSTPKGPRRVSLYTTQGRTNQGLVQRARRRGLWRSGTGQQFHPAAANRHDFNDAEVEGRVSSACRARSRTYRSALFCARAIASPWRPGLRAGKSGGGQFTEGLWSPAGDGRLERRQRLVHQQRSSAIVLNRYRRPATYNVGMRAGIELGTCRRAGGRSRVDRGRRRGPAAMNWRPAAPGWSGRRRYAPPPAARRSHRPLATGFRPRCRSSTGTVAWAAAGATSVGYPFVRLAQPFGRGQNGMRAVHPAAHNGRQRDLHIPGGVDRAVFQRDSRPEFDEWLGILSAWNLEIVSGTVDVETSTASELRLSFELELALPSTMGRSRSREAAPS